MPLVSGLAEFLDNLFEDYKTDRLPDEQKWQRNIDAINGLIVGKKWKSGEGEDWRSTTSIRLIKAKIYAAFAMLLDVFLQGGNIPFALVKSPYIQVPDELSDELDAQIEQMSDKIKEQLRDRGADKETIKKILSLSYYGIAWSKYNVLPIDRTVFVPTEADERGMPVGFELETFVAQVPGHEYRSTWSIFTDLEDEDLQANQGTFERTLTSPYELRQKIGQPYYIDDAIEHVISEHRDSQNVKDITSLPPGKRDISKRRKAIDNREFWGRGPTDLVQAFMKELASGQYNGDFSSEVLVSDRENLGHETEFMAEMAGETIIRFVPRPPKKRPFKRCFWEETLDELSGRGIADNLEDIQDVLIGMVRAFEDNKKLSANVTAGVKERYLVPGQDETVKPGQKVYITEACDDVRKALMPIIWPDVGESLLSGIELMLGFGDRIGQIPETMQSVTPKLKTGTLGEINWMMETVGKYLGMVIRNNDEHFVEPETNDIYEYNMLYGEESDPKVACIVHATGFSSFQNKMIRQNQIRQALLLVISSELLVGEAKLRPHLEEIYKSLDIDPDQFLKSEEEKRQEARDRAQMEAEAKAEAEAALEKEKFLEVEAKRDELETKAELDEQENEKEFVRDMIKEGLKERQE